jgi:L-fuconolactonase
LHEAEEQHMTSDIDRRAFLTILTASPSVLHHSLARVGQSRPDTLPVIDTHMHLFDRNRPQGVNWPRADDPAPGVSALPPRYRALTKPFGIVGAIVVEASPWLEDNQWILDQIADDTLFVGHVGFLDPAKQDFAKNLERFHRNKLYLGIRYSDRADRDIAAGLGKPEFVANVKLLADAGLSMDSIISKPELLVRLSDKVPSLRLVIPHLPGAHLPEDAAASRTFMASIAELAKRPQVFIKLSEVIRAVNGKVSTDLSAYRGWLDQLWDLFGENRVVFGSDWPNSEHVELNSYPDVFTVAHGYVEAKGKAATEKVFFRNSMAAYRWVKRDPAQPSTAPAAV